MADNLIIYYSRKGENYYGGSITELETGNAEKLAGYIQDAVGADIFEIRPVKDYPAEYSECTAKAKAELKANARPRLREYLVDISEYRNIFIVGPCWWGTYPMAIFSQLEELRFKGKRILPVMSHEGSGLGSAEHDLKGICKGAKFVRGLAVRGTDTDASEQTVKDWAVKNIR